MTDKTPLAALFAADRAAREAEYELLEMPHEELSPVLRTAVDRAFALGDEDEAQMQLRRLADLCAQVPGPEMADALLTILDHSDPGVRIEAGEALRDVAFERFKEVALAVERALDAGRDGAAMEELPFVLTEVRDPDPLPLVLRFLEHDKPDVVAAAIEALAAYGDPSVVPRLEALVSDERTAPLPDLEDSTALIGELAEAAIEELTD